MFVSFATISFVLCHCFKAMSLSHRGFTLTEPYYYRLYLQSIRGSTNNYPFSCSSLLFMAPKLMRSHFKDLPNSRAKYYYCNCQIDAHFQIKASYLTNAPSKLLKCIRNPSLKLKHPIQKNHPPMKITPKYKELHCREKEQNHSICSVSC